MYLRSILLGLPSFGAGRSYWYLKYNVCFFWAGVCVFFVIILEKGLYGKGWCLFLPCSFRVCFSIWYYLVLFLFYVNIQLMWRYGILYLHLSYWGLVLCFLLFFLLFLVVHHGLWGFCVMLTVHISFVVVSTADCMLYDI